jgi:hypothetical protein
VQRRPSLAQCAGWARRHAEEAGGRALNKQGLNTAVGLIKMGLAAVTAASVPSTVVGDGGDVEQKAAATAAATAAAAALPLKCEESFPCPNCRHVLQSPSQLVLDDAPWLRGRVDHAKLPLVHDAVGRDAALW